MSARVIGLNPGGTCRFFVPIVNAAHEGRDELHFGLPAGHCLAKRKKQGEVGVNATAFQALGRLNTFPSRGDFDQHPVSRNALCLVQLNDAFTPGETGIRIETQARIDLGRDTPWYQLKDFTTKPNQKTIHHFIQRAPPELGDGISQQGLVVGLLNRLEDQRRIGRGVLRLEGADLVEITRVGNNRGELFECL